MAGYDREHIHRHRRIEPQQEFRRVLPDLVRHEGGAEGVRLQPVLQVEREEGSRRGLRRLRKRQKPEGRRLQLLEDSGGIIRIADDDDDDDDLEL